MADNLKIISAWDERDRIKIVHKVNGVPKIKTITGFPWYFVVLLDELKTIKKEALLHFRRIGTVTKYVKDGKYVKIYSPTPFTSQDFRKYLQKNGVQVLEGDLSLWRRYMIDNNLQMETDLNPLFFDIETDSSLGGIEIGRDRIISWAACDRNDNVFFDANTDEETLLRNFLDLLDKYDIFAGWNSGGFDLPYIQERMKKYGMSYEWKKKLHVDMMQRSVKILAYDMDKIGLQGFSLEEIASKFLGEGKVKYEGSLMDLYNNHFDKFKEYNIQDVQLLKKIEKKMDMLSLMIKECEVTGTLLSKFYVGELLDNYILRESKKVGLYMPSKPDDEEYERRGKIYIIGGYVHEPTVGLYDDVRIFDFKSLYPSIIVGWNTGNDSWEKELSLEGDKAFNRFLVDRNIEDVKFEEWKDFLFSEKKRLDPEDKYFQTANNNFFRRDLSSFISTLIKNLLRLRQEYKKALKTTPVGSPEYGNLWGMQAVVKELANSMFGITGDKTARYFNKNIAEGITLTGQFLNKTSSYFLGQNGYPTIYGDTDSLFSPIPGDDTVTKVDEKVNEDLKTFLLDNFKLTDFIIALEYDKHYKRMLMMEKKRYTGRVVYMSGQATDVIFSRGTEDVKRSTIKYTKRKIMELIIMLTKDVKTLDEIKLWLDEQKEYVLNSPDIDYKDFVVSMKVSKNTESYKSKPLHVKLADKLIKEGKMLQPVDSKKGWGTRISYLVTRGYGGLEGVVLDEYAGQFDRVYYWNTHVFTPFKRLLEVAWPNENWDSYLISMKKKKEVVNENQKSLF